MILAILIRQYIAQLLNVSFWEITKANCGVACVTCGRFSTDHAKNHPVIRQRNLHGAVIIWSYTTFAAAIISVCKVLAVFIIIKLLAIGAAGSARIRNKICIADISEQSYLAVCKFHRSQTVRVGEVGNGENSTALAYRL